MEFSHYSVMLGECIGALDVKKDGIYVDCTLGGAGHALEIVKRLDGGTLIGIDRDAEALQAAKARLAGFEDRVRLVHGNFSDLIDIVNAEGFDHADGILFDLGVSSYQLDNADRGFSYRFDAPLDMRMDTDDRLTAAEVVNGYAKEELFRIIRDFGEEKYAAKIASLICRARERKRIETTFELNEIIKHAFPPSERYGEKHPSKRTFQALRIEVNGELRILENSVQDAVSLLAPHGRLAVITFHSLEDRIVKNTLRDLATGCTCNKNIPVCVCGRTAKIKLLTRKPLTASGSELEENSRSKPAKLRVAEKI